MTPKQRSILWDYFDKLNSTKALCRFCNEEYSFQATTANLKGHLRKKHHEAFLEVVEAQEQAKRAIAEKGGTNEKEQVIYLVAENPNTERSEKVVPDMLQSRNSRHSFLKRNRGVSQETVDFQQKRLIVQLTKEKIAVTSVQKELMEKELEEKTIKVMLLQEEIEHRRHMYELEKQEMVRKKQMQELAQEEMLLKIQLLKGDQEKKMSRDETSMPALDE